MNYNVGMAKKGKEQGGDEIKQVRKSTGTHTDH